MSNMIVAVIGPRLLTPAQRVKVSAAFDHHLADVSKLLVAATPGTDMLAVRAIEDRILPHSSEMQMLRRSPQIACFLPYANQPIGWSAAETCEWWALLGRAESIQVETGPAPWWGDERVLAHQSVADNPHVARYERMLQWADHVLGVVDNPEIGPGHLASAHPNHTIIEVGP